MEPVVPRPPEPPEQPPPEPPEPPGVCPLCGAAVPAGRPRCPNCNLCLAPDLSRPVLWRLAAALAGVYAAVAAVLASSG